MRRVSCDGYRIACSWISQLYDLLSLTISAAHTLCGSFLLASICPGLCVYTPAVHGSHVRHSSRDRVNMTSSQRTLRTTIPTEPQLSPPESNRNIRTSAELGRRATLRHPPAHGIRLHFRILIRLRPRNRDAPIDLTEHQPLVEYLRQQPTNSHVDARTHNLNCAAQNGMHLSRASLLVVLDLCCPAVQPSPPLSCQGPRPKAGQ